MTTHQRCRTTRYVSDDDKPQSISLTERSDIEEKLTVFALREPRRSKFFAVRFPTTKARHYVVFTEMFTDFCTVFVWANGQAQLSSVMGAPMPDGLELVAPKVIADSDWDMLAREPYFRDTFYDPHLKHGRDLAEATLGAHFDAGPELGDIFVITRELDTELDIFARAPGMPLRHAVCAEYVLEALE